MAFYFATVVEGPWNLLVIEVAVFIVLRIQVAKDRLAEPPDSGSNRVCASRRRNSPE